MFFSQTYFRLDASLLENSVAKLAPSLSFRGKIDAFFSPGSSDRFRIVNSSLCWRAAPSTLTCTSLIIIFSVFFVIEPRGNQPEKGPAFPGQTRKHWFRFSLAFLFTGLHLPDVIFFVNIKVNFDPESIS